VKIKYKICDISPILISPKMSHSDFTRAEIKKWAPSTTKTNTSSDCVVLSCRDPCRLTTGCTSSTLATTTSDIADAEGFG